MARDNGSVVGAALLGVLVGGAIGAIAGVLFAPAAGDETRRRIKEKTGDIKDSASEIVDDGRAKLEDFVDESRDRISDLVREGRSELSELTASLRNMIDEGKRAYRRRRNELVTEVEVEADADEDASELVPQAAPSDEAVTS